jgi:DinB superfamily
MAEPTMSPRDAAVRLKAIVDEILDEVHRVPAELITWKPADDVWSVLEILCHVDEFVPFWTAEAMNIVRHPDREWGRTHTDTRRLAAVNAASARSLAEVEQSLRAGVADAGRALSALREADLQVQAVSRNPRWGLKPAGFVVEDLLVHHAEKHLGQIRRNVAQYAEAKRPGK